MSNHQSTETKAELTRQQFKEKAEPVPNALPRLAFSMKETAQILGVSYLSVYRLNKRGLLKSSNGLRTKIFSKAEIERFLRA